MTLLDLIQRIIEAAKRQPAISTICCGSLSKMNGYPDIEYGVFAYEQGSHQVAGDNMGYVFRLYYIDRLNEAKSNAEMIQSIGIGVLENVLAVLMESGVSVTGVTYTPYDDKFVDECAMMMATVDITAPKHYICEVGYEDKLVKLI